MDKYYLSIINKNLLEFIESQANKSNCIPSILLTGEPGSGKTSLAKYFAKTRNTTFEFLSCYKGIDPEIGIHQWNASTLVEIQSLRSSHKEYNAERDSRKKGNEKSITLPEDALIKGKLLKALIDSQTGKSVLVIDEIDKAHEDFDTLLLNYLEDCIIRHDILGDVVGKKENLIVFITSNNQRKLNDALYRRITKKSELFFPPKKELLHQLQHMTDLSLYNSQKFHFLLGLVYEARKICRKKMAQTEIVHLLDEMLFLKNKSFTEKYTAFKNAMFFGIDDEKDFFKEMLKKYPKVQHKQKRQLTTNTSRNDAENKLTQDQKNLVILKRYLMSMI